MVALDCTGPENFQDCPALPWAAPKQKRLPRVSLQNSILCNIMQILGTEELGSTSQYHVQSDYRYLLQSKHYIFGDRIGF